LEVGVRQLGLGALLESLGGRADLAVGQREGNVGLEELLGVGTDALGCLDLLTLDDVNRTETSAVATGHLLVHLGHSLVRGESSVLLVHVGGAGTRVVTQPDSVLGHFLWLLLEDLAEGENLGVSLLHLHQTTDEIPEAGPSLGLGLGKEFDPVCLRLRIALGWHVAADNLELMVVVLHLSR